MALDPQFPTRPYVYVSYTHDAAIGGTAPRWGDTCPTPPGRHGRRLRGERPPLEAHGQRQRDDGPEQVLIEDWCQQYPSHSVGPLDFGPDGALYMSAGDGASFNFADYGQDGSPLNPCGDPPTGVGGTQTHPDRGGRRPAHPGPAHERRPGEARRHADPGRPRHRRRPAGQPAVRAAPTRTSAASSRTACATRSASRSAPAPASSGSATSGWGDWEEIDRVPNPLAATSRTSAGRATRARERPAATTGDLNICDGLHAERRRDDGPVLRLPAQRQGGGGRDCATGSSSISGLAFYDGGSFPAAYDGALFFADYSRNCIWVMFPGANGLPDPTTRQTFVAPAAGSRGPRGRPGRRPLLPGPQRRHDPPDPLPRRQHPPDGGGHGEPDLGPPPLASTSTGAASSDPDAGDTLSYAWDLDGDGPSTTRPRPTPTRTYTSAGCTTVRLRVTDSRGASDVSDPIDDQDGRQHRAARPRSLHRRRARPWSVGEQISFSGSATDAQDGHARPRRAELVARPAPLRRRRSGNCHVHEIEDFTGVASGSFSGPDHEYPSHLELTLTRHRRRRA